MCGIAGFFDLHRGLPDPQEILRGFAHGLSHRGPDDSGLFYDSAVGIGLSHARLSIIDTSPAGHQPMASRDGRWTIVFNGEIYNFNDLKSQVSAPEQLRGYSDTEVLCELIAQVGVCAAAESAVGMFAFAAWDSEQQKLHLVRDRVGIKPLYLALNGAMAAFASESRVLTQIPGLCGAVSRDALHSLLQLGYIPGTLSIHENVCKVQPGSCVTLWSADGTIQMERTVWWSADQVANEGIISGTDSELLSELDSVLSSSISSRLISDRPLGAFLSGGIDSSLVVAAMTRLSTDVVQTFSIGFEDPGYDESGHARTIANHLRTDHTEHRVTERDILDVVPTIGGLFDEPFADSSQIPTLLLCRMTRQDVIVALSGDGGDELFGGYDRYEWTVRLWKLINRIPAPIRYSSSFSIDALPNWFTVSFVKIASRLFPKHLRIRNPSAKATLLSSVLRSKSIDDLYFNIRTQWHPLRRTLAGGDRDPLELQLPSLDHHDERHQMMLWDQCNYLPDDTLVKVDRASMSVGLEARVPLLDHRLVELAWRLPPKMKVRHGESKWALRRLLERDVPRELWDRPKMGFGVPLGAWLRGPLRDWAESLIDESQLIQEGHFNASLIRKVWNQHLSGTIDHSDALWDVLMFQSWLESKR